MQAKGVEALLPSPLSEAVVAFSALFLEVSEKKKENYSITI